MKPTRSASAEDYTLMSSFRELQEQLSDATLAERLAKPLAYWALPCDRRLPYALLDRNVGDIIRASFRDLSATPGIGRKKMASLIMLLRRVVREDAGPTELDDGQPGLVPVVGRGGFDPAVVSEAVWDQWRATIRRHGLEQERLGRYAPSLRSLPTVIWDKPLGDYLDLSVRDVRELKTHGDKRVRAVLEIFCLIHRTYDCVQPENPLAVRIVPRFLLPVERWIQDELTSDGVPVFQDLRQHLVLPLLNQIAHDGGETIHRLAAGRLAVEGLSESARDQAKQLGVSRARIYQLLETCAQIMAIRWPEGRWQLDALAPKFHSLSDQDPSAIMFRETRSLMFPHVRSDTHLRDLAPVRR